MNVQGSLPGPVHASALLERLPALYFCAIRTAVIEPQEDSKFVCSFDFFEPSKAAAAPSETDALRLALHEFTDKATALRVDHWPQSWHAAVATFSTLSAAELQNLSPLRLSSKSRQLTVGVTMPATLKQALQSIAQRQQTSLADVLRQMVSCGYESFDEQIYSKSPSKVLSALGEEAQTWQPSDTEQVMLRLDPTLAVQVRTTAREFKRSSSDFALLCITHGVALKRLEVERVQAQLKSLAGPKLRGLAEQWGIGRHVALLAGVVAGTIEGPRQVLAKLSQMFSVSEYKLREVLAHMGATRQVPSFKANEKPMVSASAQPWAQAVAQLQLPEHEREQLLQLDA